jgi:hypothetical protein
MLLDVREQIVERLAGVGDICLRDIGLAGEWGGQHGAAARRWSPKEAKNRGRSLPAI